MKHLEDWLTEQQFGELFRVFQQTAFRYEGLQRYSTPEDDTAFATFLNGGPVTANQPWCDVVRAATDADKRMQRIRVVREPLNNYTRWELACLAFSADAGEDIRVDVRHGDSNHEEPDYYFPDFWLFDESVLVNMSYDIAEHGRYCGARLFTKDNLVKEAGELRDQLLTTAIPLTDYLAVRS